ncbi:MAG: DUF2914 domain-containing protein [Desulfobacterales bacterium]|jgi:hypothetical protein
MTMMKYRLHFIAGAIIAIHFFLLLPLYPLNISSANASQLTLFQGQMCEEIFANAPRNPTIVFSITQKKAVCFSSFDEVPEKMVIYHSWYHRDVPSAKIRLTLKPPRWSTYSSIQLRRTDIGPWRVEITDSKGNLLGVLRFSVTD